DGTHPAKRSCSGTYPLGRGRREGQTGERGRTTTNPVWERTPNEKKICQALEVVAKQVGTKHITSVAIAYTMHKAPYVFPIIGGRKAEHLATNIEALSTSLTPEQIGYLESIIPFNPDSPPLLCEIKGKYPPESYLFPLAAFANMDIQRAASPITPKAK
ncbi:hypothetical protein AX16_007674, partial [Volvariella volvacea WC 439]